jgi:hypothetical protein
MYKALSFCVFENEQPSKQPLDQNEESHLSGGLRNLLNLMMFMAPEVGLEPTTLRLTASEFPSPSTAIDCCKSLYTSRLDQFLSALRCYIYGLIATDFELAWGTKMGTVISIAFGFLKPSSRFAGRCF